MKSDNFFAELKLRNFYKVAVAYAVVGWLVVQVAMQVFPFFEIPNWGIRLAVLIIAIGFPIALIIVWAFEGTPEGSRTSTDKFQSHPEDVRSVSRELNVARVLEGSMQKPGDDLLINLQLIDALLRGDPRFRRLIHAMTAMNQREFVPELKWEVQTSFELTKP
jgi:hypothetical protein